MLDNRLYQFPGADPARMREEQSILAQTGNIAPGFQLLYWDTDWLSDRDIAQINEKLFFITGGYCVGKTTVMGMISEDPEFEWVAEVKTRSLREGEVNGRGILSIGEADFQSRLERGEFLLAYRANLGERCHLVGILKEDIRQVLTSRRHAGIIMHPHAVMVMLRRFWVKTFIILTSEDDLQSFRALRGVAPHDGLGQSPAGGYGKDIYLPIETTICLRNWVDQAEVTAKLIKSAVLLPTESQIDQVASEL